MSEKIRDKKRNLVVVSPRDAFAFACAFACVKCDGAPQSSASFFVFFFCDAWAINWLMPCVPKITVSPETPSSTQKNRVLLVITLIANEGFWRVVSAGEKRGGSESNEASFFFSADQPVTGSREH